MSRVSGTHRVVSEFKIATVNGEWMNDWFSADAAGPPIWRERFTRDGIECDTAAAAGQLAGLLTDLGADVVALPEAPSRLAESLDPAHPNADPDAGEAASGGASGPGAVMDMVVAHLKSNFINQGAAMWNDPARRPELIKSALKNRRRIANEGMRIRQYLDARLDQDPAAEIIVLGDVNDGQGRDLFEQQSPGAGCQRANPAAGLVHHSDHGVQYTSIDFGRTLRTSGVVASMGSVGDAFDNAMAESFFATLKEEMIYRRAWPTRHELEMEVFSYIEGFYNPLRRRSRLGNLSPIAYERMITTQNQVSGR